MNKFGVFESEIFGPILSFNYIDIIRDNWNNIIYKIRHLQGNTRIVYPEKIPY